MLVAASVAKQTQVFTIHAAIPKRRKTNEDQVLFQTWNSRDNCRLRGGRSRLQAQKRGQVMLLPGILVAVALNLLVIALVGLVKMINDSEGDI